PPSSTLLPYTTLFRSLLLTLIGLAQRFLESQLAATEGPAVGTILEVKEEKGLGTTVDAILYQSSLSKGDTIVFGTTGKPGTTKRSEEHTSELQSLAYL